MSATIKGRHNETNRLNKIVKCLYLKRKNSNYNKQISKTKNVSTSRVLIG